MIAWGTRRRSEPSLSDLESIVQGNFLKKLKQPVLETEAAPRHTSNSSMKTTMSEPKRFGRLSARHIDSRPQSHGGPSLPQLNVPRQQVEYPNRDSDDDDEEDGDDERGLDSKIDDNIVPNYEGFKAHVRRLNPNMGPNYNWSVTLQEQFYPSIIVFKRHECVGTSGTLCLLPRMYQ